MWKCRNIAHFKLSITALFNVIVDLPQKHKVNVLYESTLGIYSHYTQKAVMPVYWFSIDKGKHEKI